ncbi:prolipoprotein diacylglyceryl transferase [Streptomyces sp. SL13]|uniref:Phosphatidylglycerol--prolipoprotein diacylglyceryl transferase n=1 Tax=Streptantibioticus silvisoli TaxID=2705255 RepID=A0AA90GZ64_9ACTN|nr:prolipoprotein diacylglyceryl transferase [Streptantibioticus silvisoli]MDI5970299.1 prolipoprotein diacylglyceryl transferase [Streptantibioticus silvisoli]
MDLAYIPSPSVGVVHLGPIPLRGYAFCIIIGVFVAVWLGGRRWAARGGQKTTVADIAVWAVPFGLVGGRLYHVITDYELYFGPGKDWVGAFKVWDGGLGIWGAVALGALGAWIGCRRRGIPLPAWADAVAPGVALAQAIGRWGNWFNQELYGSPTKLPWALKIDAAHRPPNTPDIGLYQPTFLYECLWCIGVALLVMWADRKWRLGHGRAFALYVASYTVGRFWIEHMRVDYAHHILGLRLNDWTAIIVFIGAVTGFLISAKRHPGREDEVEPLIDGDGGTTGTAGSDGTATGADATADGADGAGKDAKPQDAVPGDAATPSGADPVPGAAPVPTAEDASASAEHTTARDASAAEVASAEDTAGKDAPEPGADTGKADLTKADSEAPKVVTEAPQTT